MFDLPPPSAAGHSAEAAESALAAAEAALAAEIAAEIEADGVAADAPESRTDLRVKVAWQARLQLPAGNIIHLKVRDVSELGVGLTSDEPIPARTLVSFEMDVPPLDGGGPLTVIKGTIKTTYAFAQGSGICCGGTWQDRPAGLERVIGWIEDLRR